MRTFFEHGGFSVDESLVFPDGQPHVRLKNIDDTVYCRLASPVDIVRLMFLRDLIPFRPKLHVSYLMAGRMDRSIDGGPFSLRCIARLLNSLDFESIKVFCPHSSVSLDLLSNATADKPLETEFYDHAITHFIKSPLTDFSVVYPDKGAAMRMSGMSVGWMFDAAAKVVLDKVRNVSTGRIEGIKVHSGTPDRTCVILDDLCDGGATFSAAADCLRSLGAEKVYLAVCHGIFSKGVPISGIDGVATTDSFCSRASADGLKVFPIFNGE